MTQAMKMMFFLFIMLLVTEAVGSGSLNNKQEVRQALNRRRRQSVAPTPPVLRCQKIGQKLERKRAAWASHSSNTCYDYTLRKECYCLREWLGPFRVSVRGGVVVSVLPATDQPVPTLDGFFDIINNTCVQGCPRMYKCNVIYDTPRNGGVVLDLYLDPQFRVADDEMHYFVSNITFCSA
jgi:hypothetical protein